MPGTQLVALRALLSRHAFFVGLLAAAVSASAGVAGCGDDPVPAPSLQPDAGAVGDAAVEASAPKEEDAAAPETSTPVDGGTDATAEDASDDAPADGPPDALPDGALPDGGWLSTLSIDNVSVDEGASGTTPLTFTVTLSAPTGDTVTVGYATSDGTASAGDNDYAPTNGTLTFNPGDTTKTVTVLVNGDARHEGDETFQLVLSSATNALIGPAVGTGTITNDDTPPVIGIGDAVVVEGNSGAVDATFNVTLSAPSGQTVTVHYATADGTATAGSDYTAVGDATLSFAPGETTKTLAVSVSGDVDTEPNETFTVVLSNAVNANVGGGVGTGTIQSDDGPAVPSLTVNDQSVAEGPGGTKTMTFTVTMSATAAQAVTVDYKTSDGTATSPSDYTAAAGSLTFSPGQTSKTIAVVISGDTSNEPDETFSVDLSNAAGANITDAHGVGTITNDDGVPSIGVTGAATVVEGQAGQTNLAFVVTLSAPSGKAVTLNYATSDVSASAGSDYVAASGTLTFPPGSTAQTISVPVNGDLVDEETETLTLLLATPTNATLAVSSATGTITDDDAAPTLTLGDVTSNEGTAGTQSFNFPVTLSAPSGKTVSVSYATANGSATSPTDYTAKTGSISFAPGETTKFIPITVSADLTSEPNETFTVGLAGAVNATIARATGTGTIQNDDGTLPFVRIDNPALAEGNSGNTTMTFEVRLSAPAALPVTVDYATENGITLGGSVAAVSAGTLANGGSDYEATNGTLTFAAGEVSKTISVVVHGDVANEADENFLVRLSNVSANAFIQTATGRGLITNDDALPTLFVDDVALAEGAAGTTTFTFTLTLSSVPGRDVTVGYATQESSATASGTLAAGGQDFVPTNGVITFSAGQTQKTVAVTVNGDATRENNETFFVNLSGAVNATIADGQGVGTITNDDSNPTISVGDVSLAEGTGTGVTAFVFPVTLSNPRQTSIAIDYRTKDGSAKSPGDFVAQAGTLIFNPGETAKSITVFVNKDAAKESNETFEVFLFSASPNTTLVKASGQGTIQNDD